MRRVRGRCDLGRVISSPRSPAARVALELQPIGVDEPASKPPSRDIVEALSRLGGKKSLDAECPPVAPCTRPFPLPRIAARTERRARTGA